jgi:hypothetical protein
MTSFGNDSVRRQCIFEVCEYNPEMWFFSAGIPRYTLLSLSFGKAKGYSLLSGPVA